MIRVVLIDDERPALRELEYLLKADGAFEVVGRFINPWEALERIADLDPQAVFLDIHMPQLNGIDAATRILDRSPGTEVIFVTAYDQYAIEAFELYALDYVLKPLAEGRFTRTLNRLKAKRPGGGPPASVRKFTISCLGGFQAGWEGEEPLKWRTEKTKELFAFLLHHADREVAKEKILETVWPDLNEARASHQLYNGIYYIRKTLAEYGVDRTRLTVNGSYRLRCGEVESDRRLFKEILREIERGGQSVERLEKAVAFYHGDYLEGTDWAWAESERAQLLQYYLEAVVKLAGLYLERRHFSRAETLLLKAFQKNPYVAAITRQLLLLYQYTKERNKAFGHFREYTRILREELGLEPEIELRALLGKFKK